MKKYERAWQNYIETLDQTNEQICLKIEHSYRVKILCEKLAKSLKLNEEQIEIAKEIGLLHDIGRFYQIATYNSMFDQTTLDHADYGVKILFEKNKIADFHIPTSHYSIIKEAIFFHNKYAITKDLSEETLLFAKMIRDCDKIQILELGCEKKLPKTSAKKEVFEDQKQDFYEEKLIRITKETPAFLTRLAFIFDLNFKWSKEYIERENILDRYYDTLEDKEYAQPYVSFVKKKIKEERKEGEYYVRKKI